MTFASCHFLTTTSHFPMRSHISHAHSHAHSHHPCTPPPPPQAHLRGRALRGAAPRAARRQLRRRRGAGGPPQLTSCHTPPPTNRTPPNLPNPRRARTLTPNTSCAPNTSCDEAPPLIPRRAQQAQPPGADAAGVGARRGRHAPAAPARRGRHRDEHQHRLARAARSRTPAGRRGAHLSASLRPPLQLQRDCTV